MSKLLPSDEQVNKCAASETCQCGTQATIGRIRRHNRKKANDDE